MRGAGADRCRGPSCPSALFFATASFVGALSFVALRERVIQVAVQLLKDINVIPRPRHGTGLEPMGSGKEGRSRGG